MLRRMSGTKGQKLTYFFMWDHRKTQHPKHRGRDEWVITSNKRFEQAHIVS